MSREVKLGHGQPIAAKDSLISPWSFRLWAYCYPKNLVPRRAKAKREGCSIEDIRNQSLARIPAGRYGDPREYEDAVVLLGSQRASYISGSIVRIDGGYISSI